MQQFVWRRFRALSVAAHNQLLSDDWRQLHVAGGRGCVGNSVGRFRGRSRGITLIEVVVSLALMAILLTAVLMAYGRHVRQIRQAHQRLTAVKACDELISLWMQRPSQFVGRTSGVFAAHPELRWRLVPLMSPAADAFESLILRWEVFAASDRRSKFPLVQIDVLMAKPEPRNGA